MRALLWSAGAAGRAALVGCNGGGSPATPTYDVIVVGASPAGIAAARTVQSVDRAVLVLEAMNRIGGRVYTDYTLPIPFDQGAQFFGQAAALNTILYPTVQQLGSATKAAETVRQTFYDPATGHEADLTPFLTTYGLADIALLSAEARRPTPTASRPRHALPGPRNGPRAGHWLYVDGLSTERQSVCV